MMYVIEVHRHEQGGRGRFWRPKSSGYTNFLKDAGVYAEESARIAAKGSHTCAPGPASEVFEARLDEQPASVTTASLVAWSRALNGLRLPAEDERHASPEELSLSLAWLGGDPIRAKRLAAALAARAEHRWPDTRSAALRFLALSKAEALEPDGARGWAGAAVAAAVRPEVQALALLVLGEAELLAGDVESASAQFQRALTASAGFGLVESRVLFALARVTVALGQRAEARALVQRAAATVERTGREADAWSLREVLGRLSTSRGEHAVAVAHFEASMAAWRSAGQHELVRRVAVLSVRSRLAAGDVAGAWAACRLAAHSALPAVRLGASAGMVATAAASRDLGAVDRALAEVTAGLGARRLVLPDVGDLLIAAAASLGSDPERARKLSATATAVLGPLAAIQRGPASS
jgi:tetratricopeptide (TPR) repeat protein